MLPPSTFTKVEALLGAVIGSVTALGVVMIERHLERRHSKHVWTRDELLKAVADYVAAYYRLYTHLLSQGGRGTERLTDLDIQSDLVTWFEQGGQEGNSAYARITLLGEPDLIDAANAVDHHLDTCFNASYQSEMRDLEIWRAMIHKGLPLLDDLLAVSRRHFGATDVGRPLSSFDRWQNHRTGAWWASSGTAPRAR